MIIIPSITDNKLTINYSDGENTALWEKPLEELDTNLKQNTSIPVSKDLRNKVFFKICEEDWMLVVYSDNKTVLFASGSPSYVYNTLLHIKSEAVKISFRGGKLRMLWHGHYSNPLKLDVKNVQFVIDEQNHKHFDMPLYQGGGKRRFIKYLRKIEFGLDQLLYKDVQFVHRIILSMEVDGVLTIKPVYLFHGNEEDTRYYYVPITTKYCGEYAIYVRRNLQGRLYIVRRPKYEVEYNNKFRFFNSKFVSKLLYLVGKFIKKISSKKVGLFYEKFSEQAEEGTFEVFEKLRDNSNLKSYFIIDESKPDYQRIKDKKNIVAKYTLKYYWLLYRVNIYISTEVPTHLLFLRSTNIAFQRNCLESPFVFLQHGVTYMKRQGKTSAFCRGKDGFPTYMVVGSKKEGKIVAEMLEIEDDKLINCGLPIFSRIDYSHINKDSEDKAIVMLTWKPYEEFVTNYEETEYYEKTVQIATLLEEYLLRDNIIIVAHPKIQHLLRKTHLKDRIWKKPISEALKVGKLLITDYSSVCYNSFYQGGGVVFYQEDIEYYESYVGKLIPSEDEYIGHRVFSVNELKALLDKCIDKGSINLKKLRTEQYIQNYGLINEFSDGRNIERLCDELERLKLI